jgi:hypothetical protein
MKKKNEIQGIESQEEILQSKIYIIRGQKVMIDEDLADLYGVTTKILNQAVKRNIQRFPIDFMFQLIRGEEKNLRLQSVTSSLSNYGGRRYMPYAFTEQGIAMLSSVLKSERAIMINIQIMRMFARLRELLSTHKELKEKIELLEKKYDGQFEILFKTIRELIEEDEQPKRSIGFNLK